MNDGDKIPAHTSRIRRAHYDRKKGLIVIEMTAGEDVMFPARMWPRLSRLSDDELDLFDISEDGTTLRWHRYGVEYTVKNHADNEFARLCADDEPSTLPAASGPVIDHGGPEVPGDLGGRMAEKDPHA